MKMYPYPEDQEHAEAETQQYHLNVVDRFEQTGAMMIALYWIPLVCIERHTDFQAFIDDMPQEQFEKLFPDIASSEYYNEWLESQELVQALFDYRKLGYIAEIHIPKHTNFTFKLDGSPSSWSSNSGYCEIHYVYGNTPEELLQQIEKTSEECFQASIIKFKEVNGK